MFCVTTAASFAWNAPAPLSRLAAPDAGIRTHGVRCSLDERPTAPRRAVLAAALGVGASGVTPAWAGYVTSLGIVTTKPSDAELDSDLLATKEVRKGLANLKTYKLKAAALQSTFQKDTNMALIPVIRKEFDFGALRDDLNMVTTVFDDQTQLTTDRSTRSILYDLTELENASRFKKGESERTQKKIDNVNKWFGKLDSDLAGLLAYFPAKLPEPPAPPPPPPPPPAEEAA